MHAFLETLRHILTMTAWEMEVPPAYGTLHLAFMLVGFPLCAFAAWKLRKLGDRGIRALLLSVGIFLVLSEIYKQLLYVLVVESGLGYRWGIFPFQICSIPMYLCLLIPILKPGRVQKAMYCFLMTYNLLGGFIAFFEPSGLLHGHWTLTFHALIWHMLLVFLGTYIAFSGRGCRDIRDYRNATALFVILCAAAFAINCAFWRLSNHEIKMFFVGPGNSPIIVFDWISEKFGWLVCTALYIPCVCLGAFVIYSLFQFIGAKTLRRKIGVR